MILITYEIAIRTEGDKKHTNLCILDIVLYQRKVLQLPGIFDISGKIFSSFLIISQPTSLRFTSPTPFNKAERPEEVTVSQGSIFGSRSLRDPKMGF